MSTAMDKAQREAFLADLHVGVLAITDPGHGPLTAPVWYSYEPGGDLWFLTGPDSRKGKLLARGSRVSLVAQTETPPYQYVSVEGLVTAITDPDTEQHLRPLARRYLGKEMGDGYVAATAGDRSLHYTVRIERWLSVDYSKA